MTRLEFERRRKRLTQDDLGRAILYGRCTISKLERKRPEPGSIGIRLRAALEGYFQLPIESLLEEV